MPMYEFRCPQCQHRFSQLCALGEKGDQVTCPQCSATPVQKMISACNARSLGQSGLSVPMGGTGTSGGCAGCTSKDCTTCKGS